MLHSHPATSVLGFALLAGIVSLGLATRAEDPPRRTISVQGTGTVPIAPTGLQLLVVVRAEAEIASDALREFLDSRRRAEAAFVQLGVEELTVRGLGHQVHHGERSDARDGVQEQAFTPGYEPLEGTRYWEIVEVAVAGIGALDEAARGALVARLVDTAADLGVQVLGSPWGPWNPQPLTFFYGQDLPIEYTSADRLDLERRAVDLAIDDARRRAVEAGAHSGSELRDLIGLNVQPVLEVHRMHQGGGYYGYDPNQVQGETPFAGVLRATVHATYRVE